MKKLLLLTSLVFGLIGSIKVHATNTNFMLLQFSAVIVSQQTNAPINTTNLQGVVTSIYKTDTNTISNVDILKMLETEYSTTFPTGAKLVYQVTGGGSGFKVVDANFNILQDVSSNLSFSNSVVTGVDIAPQVNIGKVVQNFATTNATEVITQTQGDAGLFYRDSHGNAFHVVGLETIKVNVSVSGTRFVYISASISIPGTGSGTAFVFKRSRQFTGNITRGTVLVTGRNIIQ